MPTFSKKILALVATLPLLGACSAPTDYDLVLRGGTLIDGSNGAPYIGDIGIVDDKIVAVGDLTKTRAGNEIDVSGLVVAPGFINLHSHATPEGLPSAVNVLSQGVTTEIINADGFGAVDLETQLRTLAAGGLAVNVGAMIGLNSVWKEVVGLEEVRPTPAQMKQMQDLVGRGLQAGAWGVSAGLDYVPGYYASTNEVIQMLAPFSGRGIVFANHDRVTPESNFSSIAGMSETIFIGESAGLIPLVTHMKVQGWEQGKASTILDRMRIADTAFTGGAVADVYPYLAGQTGLEALIIPSWAQAGGREAMLARFSDPDQRAQIIEEAERAMNLRFGGPEGVLLMSGNGMELTAAMEQMELDSPGEAVVRLLEESEMRIIARFGAEADLIAILRHPTSAISCDCGAWIGERAHPRYWGTFPKVLGEYVREKKVLTLENAVYKMSGLPAEIIGLNDRGLLKPGMYADIAVFDPDTIADHASYEEPNLMSEGMIYVLVNGRVAWDNGQTTGVQAGRTTGRGTPY